MLMLFKECLLVTADAIPLVTCESTAVCCATHCPWFWLKAFSNHQDTNGLQRHTDPRTAKLKAEPMARPAIKQNCATVAAVSTSSFLSLALCWGDEADIMPMVAIYPFVMPNTRRRRRYNMSELISAIRKVPTPSGRESGSLGSNTLHERNKGMKSTRITEREARRFGNQMKHRGNVHKYRPTQSPTLKTTK